MTYLLLGAAVLALISWAGRRSRLRREWRFLTSAAALVAFAGAAYAAVRSAWVVAAVLTVMGLWLSVTTRVATSLRKPVVNTGLSRAEACSLLGVEPDAGADEIKAAYARLMRLAHPDRGGTAGLAAQLNAARDRLLKP